MSEGYVRDGAGQGPWMPTMTGFAPATWENSTLMNNLTYVDRLKDSLRRRGENISSVEVEAVVMRHPAVLEAAAVGVPSQLGEDDVLLIVTVSPGAALDCPELLDFCADRMPYFWVPRFVEIVSELPKNGIGRIRKDLLRNRGLKPDTWDREKHGYTVIR